MFKKWLQSQMQKANDQAVAKQVDFIKEQSNPAIVRMHLKHLLYKLGIKSAKPIKLGGMFRSSLRKKDP